MSATNQDNKQGGGGRPNYIKLIVVDPDSNESHFRINMSTQLGKLKNTYCLQKGVHKESFIFFYADRRIQDHETPKHLEMKEGDVIEAYEEQSSDDGVGV